MKNSSRPKFRKKAKPDPASFERKTPFRSDFPSILAEECLNLNEAGNSRRQTRTEGLALSESFMRTGAPQCAEFGNRPPGALLPKRAPFGRISVHFGRRMPQPQRSREFTATNAHRGLGCSPKPSCAQMRRVWKQASRQRPVLLPRRGRADFGRKPSGFQAFRKAGFQISSRGLCRARPDRIHPRRFWQEALRLEKNRFPKAPFA